MRVKNLILGMMAATAFLSAVLMSDAEARALEHFDDSCNIDCHSVTEVTPGECWPGHHWAQSGGSGGGIPHKDPETCFPGTCAEQHECGNPGEGEFDALLATLLHSANEKNQVSDRLVRKVLTLDNSRIRFNHERSLLQAFDCVGGVLAQVPLTAQQMNIAHVARGTTTMVRAN